MTWVSWAIVITAAIVISIEGIYLYCYPKSGKRWVRLFSIAAVFYTGILYLLSAATEFVRLPDQGPVFARPAIVILLALLGAEATYDLLRRR